VDDLSASRASRPAGAVAVVTGAGSGIGAATARRLAADGFTVLGVGRDLQRLAAVASAVEGMAVMNCDLTQEVRALEVVRQASTMGPTVVVVHAAGVGGYLDEPVDRQTPEAWRRTMLVNLDSAFLLLRAAAPYMRAAGWGRFVAVGSTAGTYAAPAQAAYSASKAGLLGLVRSAAYDLGEYAATCNAVVPGWVQDSLMAQEDARLEAERQSITVDEVWARRAADYPGGTIVSSAEVADVIGFLVSDDARAVNGQAVGVTRGSNW
jgi:NAD(P)-dependent dehydrogenase (short-subunit alcohol dehydrogenase family)